MISLTGKVKALFSLCFAGLTLLSINHCNLNYVYDVVDEKTFLHANMQINANSIGLEEGTAIVCEYGYHKEKRALIGEIYDGGSSRSLYIEFEDQNSIMRETDTLPRKIELPQPGIKLAYIVIANPGFFKVFPGETISGTITINSFKPDEYLELDVDLQAIDHQFGNRRNIKRLLKCESNP